MIHRVLCGWCHETVRRHPNEPTWCSKCGHEAGVPRLLCRCLACTARRVLAEEVNDLVVKDRLERN